MFWKFASSVDCHWCFLKFLLHLMKSLLYLSITSFFRSQSSELPLLVAKCFLTIRLFQLLLFGSNDFIIFGLLIAEIKTNNTNMNLYVKIMGIAGQWNNKRKGKEEINKSWDLISQESQKNKKTWQQDRISVLWKLSFLFWHYIIPNHNYF